jgi:predicted amidohydrolase YtcJ
VRSRRRVVPAVAAALIVAVAAIAPTQEAPADLILSNGRIITVDERFSIAQAVAVRGDRIVAVGTDTSVARLAAPSTRRIDLRGKAVIPGLIDNHMHLLRAGTTWQREVRWDGVGSRKQAFDLLAARVTSTPAGEWIYILGGWTADQFADDPRPPTREELDAIAPQHPVFLQASYYRGYANTRAMRTLGITDPSGVVDEANLRGVAARLPVATGDALEFGTRLMFRDLNRAGLTAFGSAGCEADVLPIYRRWTERRQLNVRVFCITSELRQRTGDPFLDHVAYGEVVFAPLHDPMFVRTSSPKPDELLQWRRIATEVAKVRMSLHVHANLTNTIGAFLDQIEIINRDNPIAGLRWTLAHVNQIDATHLARMKKLGVSAAVHPWAVINGGINRTVFGDAAIDMPPLKTIQDSGVMWGLGSDGSRANQILPFQTLSWAVTGRMVGGARTLRQTISREQALIAHTRSNAWFVFQEKDLGSIEAGKRADLVVLDRDYLAVPEGQIKDITSVMTIVNGRIVYETQ